MEILIVGVYMRYTSNTVLIFKYNEFKMNQIGLQFTMIF